MTYSWQHTDWPDLTYSLTGIEEKLYLFSEKTGTISGGLYTKPVY